MHTQYVHERVAALAGLLALLAALFATGAAAGSDERPLGPADIDAFIEGIEGAWQGQATITPIGPRPYDMTFARTVAGGMEGAAEPGAAIHTWTFWRDGENLRLRFLTTFRGNTEPILMAASGEADGSVVFRAVKPAFLRVRVSVRPHTLVIRVFHGDRLHVEIRLRRRR